MKAIIENLALTASDALEAAAGWLKPDAKIVEVHLANKAKVRAAQAALATVLKIGRAARAALHSNHKQERQLLAEKQSSEMALLKEQLKLASEAASGHLAEVKTSAREHLNSVRNQLLAERLQHAKQKAEEEPAGWLPEGAAA